jgi:phosphoribosylaminoimidazole-succinocarboxamide synthase
MGRVSLPLVHEGKVRDSYRLNGTALGRPLRLVRVSDRISIFDFVLGFEVPQKGEVLAAMSAFWRSYLRGLSEANMLAALRLDTAADGRGIDRYLSPAERGNRDLWKRATVVRECDMLPYEAIVRGYLTGTGYSSYKESGAVCGHALPAGLANGSRLKAPVFTPTTKAQDGGHDEHLAHQSVEADAGAGLGALATSLYLAMAKRAGESGILMADTKLEFSKDLVLCDEVGTPDSSRFWRKSDYEASFPAELPPSYDKQFVREWGIREGISDKRRFDPKDPEHKRKAKALVPPPSLIDDTRERYMDILKMLTGLTLKECQRELNMS